ncbi:hypothetical protein FHE72_03485 [Rossellomorea vietnamensis]|uniref:DUF4362 domain-containing protein n=1 Tax=Rossellomorea vietnamensis TaxID=218284 RepID=A0A6I6UE19_9BACI|nr:hypothetical protein [Rossellomorea vietnamensis]QHE60198.1 hypothetical protein FHE72_03485 [Rossellomorea vietnamensis]
MRKMAFMFLTGSLFFAGCSNSEQADAYTVKEATDNGDTLVDEEGEVTNLDKLLRFVDGVQEKKESEVTVSNFFNNQISVNEISFDGNEINYLLKTGTGEEKKSVVCEGIEERSGFISLQGCDGEEESIGIVQVSEYKINKARASMKD